MVCCQWLAIWIARFTDPQLQVGRPFSFNSSPPDQKEGLNFVDWNRCIKSFELLCISSWAPYFLLLADTFQWFAGHTSWQWLIKIMGSQNPWMLQKAPRGVQVAYIKVLSALNRCGKWWQSSAWREKAAFQRRNVFWIFHDLTFKKVLWKSFVIVIWHALML